MGKSKGFWDTILKVVYRRKDGNYGLLAPELK